MTNIIENPEVYDHLELIPNPQKQEEAPAREYMTEHERLEIEPVVFSISEKDKFYLKDKSRAPSVLSKIGVKGIAPQEEPQELEKNIDPPVPPAGTAVSARPGEFILLCDGSLVEKSYDISVIERLVDLLIFERNVKPDSILVLKALDLKIGVHVVS